MKLTLNMAMLFAKDTERLKAFYRDGLGLAVVEGESSEGWVVFDAGAARFALHAIPPHIARDIAITTPPQPREDTPIKLIFATANLAAACAQVTRAGATLLPARNPRSRDALDPEGNVFQLTTTP